MPTIGKNTTRKGKLISKGFDRSIGHDLEGVPILIITPTYLRSSKPVEFCITQRDAWMYSEEHNPMFKQAMMTLCTAIHDYYQLGLLTVQRLSIIASVVQEGLDDLIMTPRKEKAAPVVIGEVGMKTGGGNRIIRDLTSNDIPSQVVDVVGTT